MVLTVYVVMIQRNELKEDLLEMIVSRLVVCMSNRFSQFTLYSITILKNLPNILYIEIVIYLHTHFIVIPKIKENNNKRMPFSRAERTRDLSVLFVYLSLRTSIENI